VVQVLPPRFGGTSVQGAQALLDAHKILNLTALAYRTTAATAGPQGAT